MLTWRQMGVALFTRAVERSPGRAGSVRALVQSTNVGLEEHAVDINASAVARMDMVRVGELAPDGRLRRLGIC